ARPPADRGAGAPARAPLLRGARPPAADPWRRPGPAPRRRRAGGHPRRRPALQPARAARAPPRSRCRARGRSRTRPGGAVPAPALRARPDRFRAQPGREVRKVGRGPVTANALAALEPFLRAWRAVAPARERCGVCAHEIDGDDHEHLVELDRRALLCACSTCAALFAQPGAADFHGNHQRVPEPSRDGPPPAKPAAPHAHFHGNPQRVPEPSRDGPPPAKPAAPHAISYRVVPKRVLVDPGFQLDEAQWAALAVPVRLAFIFYNSRLARWVALYPSPGGAAESDVPPAAFEVLAAATRLVAEVAPDVEALLVYGRRAAKLEIFVAPID